MNIINIINFIRAYEPRSDVDLAEPLREQLNLLQQYNLKGTFLAQYDALLDDDLLALILQCKKAGHEIGCWFEIVRPQCEAAGIPWRGRWAWDWHADVGFPVGYPPSERERLADAYMALFMEKIGYYPSSAGSWIIDAHTLKYMADKYGITASCNCKEQWGTDGYTLWGGYYGQGYYPNMNNVYAPANNPLNQIDVPVFRMLGSDPIYQYDLGLDIEGTGAAENQAVVTLEPVYTGNSGGGGIPEWVDWFFRENYNGHNVSFSYAQAGQENSFGWPAMSHGLTYQHKVIADYAGKDKLSIMTLQESGAWYKRMFAESPPCAIAALSDWKNEGRRSIWYSSKYYRANLYCEKGKVRLRDVHVFRDAYHERYMTDVTNTEILVYDNPPLMDGNRWSGGGVRAGIYIRDGNGYCGGILSIRETEDSLIVELACSNGNGGAVLSFTPDSIILEGEGLYMLFRYKPGSALEYSKLSGDTLVLTHNGYEYAINTENGVFKKDIEFTLESIEKQSALKLKL